MTSGRQDLDLPITAYLVLGILATYDEQLSAGEIKVRAEFSFGHFYWSPSVSHIRRELTKLIARNLVSQNVIQMGKRTASQYQTTARGEDVLRQWVQAYPGSDQMMVKHPVILKTWLAGDTDPHRVIATLDQHIATTRSSLDEALWAVQRSEEIGVSDDPAMRFPRAVLNYSIRALYSEMSNIQQLRDEISRGTDADPVRRVHRRKGTLRRRDR